MKTAAEAHQDFMTGVEEVLNGMLEREIATYRGLQQLQTETSRLRRLVYWLQGINWDGLITNVRVEKMRACQDRILKIEEAITDLKMEDFCQLRPILKQMAEDALKTHRSHIRYHLNGFYVEDYAEQWDVNHIPRLNEHLIWIPKPKVCPKHSSIDKNWQKDSSTFSNPVEATGFGHWRDESP